MDRSKKSDKDGDGFWDKFLSKLRPKGDRISDARSRDNKNKNDSKFERGPDKPPRKTKRPAPLVPVVHNSNETSSSDEHSIANTAAVQNDTTEREIPLNSSPEEKLVVLEEVSTTVPVKHLSKMKNNGQGTDKISYKNLSNLKYFENTKINNHENSKSDVNEFDDRINVPRPSLQVTRTIYSGDSYTQVEDEIPLKRSESLILSRAEMINYQNALEKICYVMKEVENWKLELEKTDNSSEDFFIIETGLTNAMIVLDAIQTSKNEFIKQKRKNGILLIQAALKLLDEQSNKAAR